MAIDVASQVGLLLYRYDTIVLPNFGAIVASYKAATIDHVQGLLHPPSKQLRFNAQIRQDDGLLTDHISKHFQVSKLEAQQAIGRFVRQLEAALDKREIIVLPQVGRLYKDYENNFQFLQENTNFNIDSYSLPTIQFYPILRNSETANIEAPIPREKWVKLPEENRLETIFRQLRPVLPAAVGAVLLIVAFSIFYLKTDRDSPIANAQKLPVVDRLNTKPSLEHASILESVLGQSSETTAAPKERSEPPLETTIEEIDSSLDEDGEFETEIDTEAVTALPDQKECVIIIGAFRNKAGVRKRIEQIYDLGYDAYQEKVNGLTKVGVQFSYEREREVSKVLKLMRIKFDKSAYVLDM
ncbi:MAG: hypothetical protein AAFP19_15470 [Bacteroidota bacterium]